MKYKIISADSIEQLEKLLNENAAKGYAIEKYNKALDVDMDWLYTVIMVRDELHHLQKPMLSGVQMFSEEQLKNIVQDFIDNEEILYFDKWWEENKHKY